MASKYISLEEFLIKNPEPKQDLSKIPCKNGRFCSLSGCKFLHNLKTKMCKFEEKCRRRENCNFAHSKEELYIPLCKYGFKCKFTNCSYKHLKPIEEKKEEKIQEIKSPEENLSLENFPETIENVENFQNINDYTSMKEIIKYTDFATIEEKSTEEILDKYNCILDFKKIKIIL